MCSRSPVPSINWRRVDGAPFSRKVDTRKASGVLEIPYFQQEDAGTYECVAENSRGMNTVKGKLSFYGKVILMRINIWPACTTSVTPTQMEMHPPASTSSLMSPRRASAEDQWACTRREALFNATSKWLKAVSHDASNILIQIKGGMGLSPWMWPCWWTSRWVTPDGVMIDVQVDWRSNPLQCAIHRRVTHMSRMRAAQSELSPWEGRSPARTQISNTGNNAEWTPV